MVTKNEILDVVHQQSDKLNAEATYERNLLSKLRLNDSGFANIISGIRRCGKSTLLAQLIKKQTEQVLYINFDTPRLFGFDFLDFRALDDILQEQDSIKWLFFDEIQTVKSWEIYVRGKLDQGYGIVVTGSSASLLSRELGTKLTGRHLSKELFPFSYKEFCGYVNAGQGSESLAVYLEKGGFPQYLKTENKELLTQLVTDIIYRDIAVRYNIRDEQSLKKLFVFLVSNVGNLVSATKLKGVLGIKSTATLLDYFSYFEQTYLLYLLPKFSYSYKTQLVNPRKIYLIDIGLQFAMSSSFTDDSGRRLENMVFLELRRTTTELFYFNENNKECDFVVCRNGKPRVVIQVCYKLTNENLPREQNGVLEAMNYFNLNTGYLLTFNQTDKIYNGEKNIDVIPVYEFDFDGIFDK